MTGARPETSPHLPHEAVSSRIVRALKGASKTSVATIWFLARIMIPVSFAVSLLAWSGALRAASAFLKPVMGILGLPGDAAVVLMSAVFLSNYSAIAAMNALSSVGLREALILAIMCLTAHNMIVETAVMRKTGSSAAKMVSLRLGAAFVMGWIFNLVLPAGMGAYAGSASVAAAGAAPVAGVAIGDMLRGWAISTTSLVGKIVILVICIMIVQRLLQEFRVAEYLSRLFAPLMKVFGLRESSSFLWVIINLVGYAYGAGVIREEIERGGMTKSEADLFNHHAATCHSLLEDSFLYFAVGIPVLMITIPRILLAIVVVWSERARRNLFRASFRVGTH